MYHLYIVYLFCFLREKNIFYPFQRWGYLSQSLKGNIFALKNVFPKLIYITISELLRVQHFDVGAIQVYSSKLCIHTHTHTLKCKFDILFVQMFVMKRGVLILGEKV